MAGNLPCLGFFTAAHHQRMGCARAGSGRLVAALRPPTRPLAHSPTRPRRQPLFAMRFFNPLLAAQHILRRGCRHRRQPCHATSVAPRTQAGGGSVNRSGVVDSSRVAIACNVLGGRRGQIYLKGSMIVIASRMSSVSPFTVTMRRAFSRMRRGPRPAKWCSTT